MESGGCIIIDCRDFGIELSLALRLSGGQVTNVEFNDAILATQYDDKIPLHINIAQQLLGYLRGDRDRFSLPLLTSGTPFQQRVWQALQAIPYGQVLSYGALAKQLGSSARAIGGACRANPIPVIIPCHRVVAAHDIGGFSGDRYGGKVIIKQWLLAHEQD